jgi:hypothetical protein
MLLPEVIIKKVLDQLIRQYYIEYRSTNQVNLYGTVNLQAGFNWNTQPQQLIINGITLDFIIQTNNVTEIVTYFNTLLATNLITTVRAYAYGNRVGLITIATDGAVQTITITDSTAVDTFGFVIGTFTGTLDKSKTRLYQIFEDISYDNYNWPEEVAKILIDTYETKKRPLKIYQHYNRIPYAGSLNIVISFTNERQGQKNIGVHEEKYINPGLVNMAFDKYEATYLLHIVSDSYNEVVTIYTFLKAIIRANYHIFSFNGLDDFRLSGGNPRVETVMPDLFDWGLEITFDYHYKVPIGFNQYYPATILEFTLEKINDQLINL